MTGALASTRPARIPSFRRAGLAAVGLALRFGLAGCASVPATQHYRLTEAPTGEPEASAIPRRLQQAGALYAPEASASPSRPPGAGPPGSLSVSDFSADAAYEDVRIAYRRAPVRLDYYNYHEWVALPGVMVADVLRSALDRTGWFDRVLREPASGTDLRLEGRVLRFEEVDLSDERWEAALALELWVEDAKTDAPLFHGTFERSVPVAERSPAGVAVALSVALGLVVEELAPTLARLAAEAAERNGPTGP